MKAARTQCAMVLSTVNKNSVVHSIVHSTVPVLILVQQLQTPVCKYAVHKGDSSEV